MAGAKAALADSEQRCAAVHTQLGDQQAKTLRLELELGVGQRWVGCSRDRVAKVGEAG